MAAAQPSKRTGRKLILAVVCLVCVGAGVALPMVVPLNKLLKGKEAEGGEHEKPKAAKHAGKHDEAATAVVPFGELVVNLAEDRMTRYLRLKIALVVEAEDEKTVTEKLTKLKAVAKSKLLGHIAGKSLKDVAGTVGVNRLQREVQERIEDVLYPAGDGHLRGVVFEEYIVQ